MRNNYRKAVSLVEVMIGVFLLALILVPSLNVVISQTQTVTSTRDHSQAAFLADKILETAKAWNFNMLDEDRFTSEDTKKKTLEYRLRDENDSEYNTYPLNGITYSISSDKNYTSIDPITAINANPDDLPVSYAFKYRIEYIGKDVRDHHLDIHTILSQR